MARERRCLKSLREFELGELRVLCAFFMYESLLWSLLCLCSCLKGSPCVSFYRVKEVHGGYNG